MLSSSEPIDTSIFTNNKEFVCVSEIPIEKNEKNYFCYHKDDGSSSPQFNSDSNIEVTPNYVNFSTKGTVYNKLDLKCDFKESKI